MGVLLGKLVIPHLSKNSPNCMESEGSLHVLNFLFECWVWVLALKGSALDLSAAEDYSEMPTCSLKSEFMCFVWISEQTAVIPVYNTNWLVFITETESVYCAVRTETLHLFQGNFLV